mmetsp:Transcript_21523/g.33179  ORF Transcript_21523/g.33179 Transcript_21523/m.33179 type:complete len:108 (-) Transcript_21523:886-1209(-)
MNPEMISPREEGREIPLDSEEHVDSVVRQHFRASALFDKFSNRGSPKRTNSILGAPAPVSRMFHASSLLGGCVLAHGGYSSATDSTLSDLVCFDIEFGKWVNMKQTK